MKKRILVVEDERLVAEDILRTLEDLGYAVTSVVSSGEEAIATVAKEKPDLVLLDIVLKGELSGIEVAEHIRSHYRVPVVYLSAYADAPTLERAKVTEPYGYILKPFEDRELHTAIEIALYKSRAEKCIAHLNAILRATRNVNKLIVKEKDRDSLIQGICQHLIETRGYCKARIILLKEGGQMEARAVAGASELLAPFMTSLRQGELPDCAMQVLTGINSLVIDDITSTCRTCVLRNANQGKGAYVGRLESHGQMFGILGVVLPADMTNDEKEQLLFQEVRDDVGFALRSLELEQKRCQTEKALKMAQFSLDHAADAIFWIGPSAQFYYANEAACRSLGYTREELLSLTVSDIDPLFPAEKWPAHWQELKERGSLSFESTHRRKNGTTFPVEIRTNYLEFEDREYNFASARDITERKQADEEREKLEAQLRQSQKMEAIGTLAGGIAHDFNNILMAMMGYAEMATLAITPEHKAQEYLEQVLKAGNRAKGLVGQILTFSRRIEGEKKPVSLSILAKESLKLLRAGLPATIAIQWDLAGRGIVIADPIQMHQLIMNLCTNAYHAMEEEGGVLKITLADVDLDDAQGSHLNLPRGPYVKLEVKDSGKGIDPRIRERIFEPYFTTKERRKGTGMGLATVLGIVKSYGGDITVSSEPGKGSVFTVYLPRSIEDVSGSDIMWFRKPNYPMAGNASSSLMTNRP